MQVIAGSEAPSSSEAIRPRAEERLRVLVVEDDDDMREALVDAVRELGHECRVATDGFEGWEMQQQDPADVIISDWMLPGIDGLELCRRTRVTRDQGTYTYFILVTGMVEREYFLHGADVGADDYYTKPVDLDELRARLISAGRVVAVYRELAEKNALLRRDSEASFRLARVDPLTHIANRLSMDEDLRALWSRAARYGHHYSIAICDIDRFKDFNDTFGHVAGDEALRRVTDSIRNELREGDGLYRYGGEEFLVLLPEQGIDEAHSAMERVRAAVARLGIPAAEQRSMTISIGIAEYGADSDHGVDDWIRRADAALYRAKRAGRDCIREDSDERPRAFAGAEAPSYSHDG